MITGREISLGKLNITFYGGVGEIGGNLILIEYKGDKIVLDIGLSFNKYRAYYEWPLRTPRGIDEMVKLGVAPNIDGLYVRWVDKYTPESGDTDIGGIFISHAHMDHIGLLSQVNRNIDIYMGKTSYIIEGIRREVSRNMAYESYEGLKLNTFRTGDRIKVGSFTIKPIHVDHSIPGAYSFIIETPEATILYTGDFRLHGEVFGEKSLSNDMIEEARETDIDIMISEGTRFHDSSLESEKDVYNSLSTLSTKFDGDILMTFSNLDIDRFESLLKALEDSGRVAILSDRHFLFVWKLLEEDDKLRGKIRLDQENIRIYTGDKKPRGWKRKYYDIWLKKGYYLMEKLDEAEDEGYYVYNDFIDYLPQLREAGLKHGAIAVFSNSEPFNEEGWISQEKIYNWLASLNIPSYRIHCSGHIHPLHLKKFVEEVGPRRLYIIHSETPDSLSRFLGFNPKTGRKL